MKYHRHDCFLNICRKKLLETSRILLFSLYPQNRDKCVKSEWAWCVTWAFKYVQPVVQLVPPRQDYLEECGGEGVLHRNHGGLKREIDCRKPGSLHQTRERLWKTLDAQVGSTTGEWLNCWSWMEGVAAVVPCGSQGRARPWTPFSSLWWQRTSAPQWSIGRQWGEERWAVSGKSVFLLCVRLADKQREGLNLSDGKKLFLTSLVLRSLSSSVKLRRVKEKLRHGWTWGCSGGLLLTIF